MNHNINLIGAECYYIDYYGSFLYVPIKIFFSTVQERLEEEATPEQIKLLNYYLSDYSNFIRNFDQIVDNFFETFIFLIHKRELFQDYSQFLSIYYSTEKFQINGTLSRYIQGSTNILLAPEVTSLPNTNQFDTQLYAQYFMNTDYSINIMKNFRPKMNMKFGNLISSHQNITCIIGNELNMKLISQLKSVEVVFYPPEMQLFEIGKIDA